MIVGAAILAAALVTAAALRTRPRTDQRIGRLGERRHTMPALPASPRSAPEPPGIIAHPASGSRCRCPACGHWPARFWPHDLTIECPACSNVTDIRLAFADPGSMDP